MAAALVQKHQIFAKLKELAPEETIDEEKNSKQEVQGREPSVHISGPSIT